MKLFPWNTLCTSRQLILSLSAFSAVVGMHASALPEPKASSTSEPTKPLPAPRWGGDPRRMDPAMKPEPGKEVPRPTSNELSDRPGKKDRSNKDDLDLPIPEPGAMSGKQCIAWPANKRFPLTLTPNPAGLDDLVGWIKAITCRRIIYAGASSAIKVNIQIPDLITKDEAYKIFLSALNYMSLSIQKVGTVYKIGPIADTKATASFLASGDEVPSTDQFFLKSFKLKHVSVEDIKGILGSLKSKDTQVQELPSLRSFIIADTGVNLQRWEELIQDLDRPIPNRERMFVYPLEFASANEVVGIITSLYGSGGSNGSSPAGMPRRPNPYGPPQGPMMGSDPSSMSPSNITISRIFPDTRSNSVIYVCTTQCAEAVNGLIKRLDSKLNRSANSEVHYYNLQHATAEGMVSLLQGMGVVTSVANSAEQASSPSSGSTSGTGASSSGYRPSSSMSSNPSNFGPNSQNQQNGPFQSPVRVVADIATNSLLCFANSSDYMVLESILKKVDRPRLQVLLRIGIFEINLKKTKALGLSYHGGLPIPALGNATVLGGLNGMSSANPLNSLSQANFALGLIGPFLPAGALGPGSPPIPQYGIIVNALQNDNITRLVQQPDLLATNHLKTKWSDGQNLPFPSAVTTAPSSAPGGLGITPLQSIQRNDVALEIEAVPHINESNVVKLDLKLNISDVFAENYNNNGPALNKRVIEAPLVAIDQTPAIVGAIMVQRESIVTKKIPFLGDIPVLKYLFRNDNKIEEERMLLITVTPFILRTPEDHGRIVREKQDAYDRWIDTMTPFKKKEWEKPIEDYRFLPTIFDQIDTAVEEMEFENELAKEKGKEKIPLRPGTIDPLPFPTNK